MTYDDAAKKVRAEKPKDNFMVIDFAGSIRIVLPHKQGVALMEALSQAEKLDNAWGSPKNITELSNDSISTSVLSHQQYERHKIATLLACTVDEVRQAEEDARKPKFTP